MELGVMTRMYSAPSLCGKLDEIRAQGIRCVHLNPANAGIPDDDREISRDTSAWINREIVSRGLHIATLSGTYNMIHPDEGKRKAGMRRLLALIAAAPAMGAEYISLCTGTNCPDDMWKAHPDNDSRESWSLLLSQMEKISDACENCGVTALIETEKSNVVNTPEKAEKMIKTLHSDNIAVIMDPANLVDGDNPADMNETIRSAIGLLGPYIRVAHAKDISPGGGFTAPGKGILDFRTYFRLLSKTGFDGAIVMHGFASQDVPMAAAYLGSLWEVPDA